MPGLAALAALLPYLNSLQNEFTFDDLPVIRENPAIRGSLWDLATWVYDPGGYRPLTMLTYAANDRLGESALGFHLVNMALHSMVSVAVFALARRVLASEAGALVAALVFAVHPIHTEAVTSIVGRAELLAALFSLAALLAATRADGARRPAGWRTASLALFAAALLSKESALATLPLVGMLYWWFADSPRPRILAIRLAPYGLVTLAYLALRVAVVGSLGLPNPPHFVDNPLAYEPWEVRVRTALIILGQYLSQLVLPLRLSADYSFATIVPAFSWSDPRFLAAAAIFTALAASLALAARRAPVLIVAACFAALPLALTANLFFPIGTIRAERLLYMPSVGLCLASGWLAARIRTERRRAGAALIGALVMLLGARSWVRNRDWRDSMSLFTATVEASPGSSKAHYNLGVALGKAGRLDDAMAHYRKSFEIYPDAAAAFSIARAYDLERRPADALDWYERAVALDWAFVNAHTNQGVLHYDQGRLDSSEAALRAAVCVSPEDASARINLAIALSAQQRSEEARFVIGEIDPAEIQDQALLEHYAETNRAVLEAPRR